MKIEDLKNKNIAILWFWKEWQSSLNFLLNNKITQKNKITILDANKNIEKKLSINYILWEKYLDNLEEFDVIIKTSWISSYNEKINKFLDKITSQTQIFFDNFDNEKIIAVTATKWKSTTVSLIYEVLKTAWYKVKLVWNIWNPFLDEIEFSKQKKYDYIICELSSYMLEGLNKTNFISVLWNIYPDHLDYHNWFENYKNAKLNILKNSKINIVRDNIKANFSDISHVVFFWKSSENNFYFDDKNNYYKNKKLLWQINSNLAWMHNLFNITSVIAVCDAIWIDFFDIKKWVEKFNSLPHRLENIWEFSWIIFIDDAISTTPESTIEAIKTYWENIWTIFLGWKDRGYEYNDLLNLIFEKKIGNLVVFPEIYDKICEILEKNSDKKINLLYTDKMSEAVKFAYDNTEKWKICLLSTAAPSYNLWKNFEEKWREFKKYVIKYSSKK